MLMQDFLNGIIRGIWGYSQDGIPDGVGQEGRIGRDVFRRGDCSLHLLGDPKLPLGGS